MGFQLIDGSLMPSDKDGCLSSFFGLGPHFPGLSAGKKSYKAASIHKRNTRQTDV